LPDQGFDYLHVYEIFVISETSRQAFGMNKLSLLWVTGLSSWGGGKWPGCDVDHSPPFSTEVKHEWNYTLLPIYAFIAPKETSPVPDIINSSFFPYAEFLSSTTVTVYINTLRI